MYLTNTVLSRAKIDRMPGDQSQCDIFNTVNFVTDSTRRPKKKPSKYVKYLNHMINNFVFFDT